MRVKLSYTVEEDQVLKESAKLIRLIGPDLEGAIALYNACHEELQGDKSENGAVNVRLALEKIEDFRKVLTEVDVRFFEVSEIISGFDEYQNAREEHEQNVIVEVGPGVATAEVVPEATEE